MTDEDAKLLAEPISPLHADTEEDRSRPRMNTKQKKVEITNSARSGLQISAKLRPDITVACDIDRHRFCDGCACSCHTKGWTFRGAN